MRDGASIVPQSFLWILEITADYLEEWFNRYHHARFESIEVVDRNQTGFHIPLMVLEHLIVGLDVRQWYIVLAEHVSIQIGIFVPCLFVLVESQRLVITD